MKILLVGCILLVFLSCSEPKQPYLLPDNAESLISGDVSKTWKLAKRMNDGNRMNMGECFLAYKQTFKSDRTVSDNNSSQKDCGESLHAKWEIVVDEKGHSFIKMSSPQISELLNIKEDYKMFKIIELTEASMKLAFYHKQFSDRTTTIVDHLVPEYVTVQDRDFHW